MDAFDPKFWELVQRAISEEDERITAETAAVFGIDSVLAENGRIDVCIQSGDHHVVLQTDGEEKRYVIPAALISVAKRRKKLPIRRRTKLVVENEFAYLDYEEEAAAAATERPAPEAVESEHDDATHEIVDGSGEWMCTDVVEFPDLGAAQSDLTDAASELNEASGESAAVDVSAGSDDESAVPSGEWSRIDAVLCPDPIEASGESPATAAPEA